MSQQLKDDLIAIRNLLATPDRWTKGALARDKRREKVLTHDPRAHSFCLLGACLRIGYGVQGCSGSGDVAHERVDAMIAAIMDQLPTDSGITYNDDIDTSHEDILNVLDKTIAARAGQ